MKKIIIVVGILIILSFAYLGVIGFINTVFPIKHPDILYGRTIFVGFYVLLFSMLLACLLEFKFSKKVNKKLWIHLFPISCYLLYFLGIWKSYPHRFFALISISTTLYIISIIFIRMIIRGKIDL
ncbi:MAG: hypothetical protein IJK39_05135 [Bacteroidales bacterium]|nr:hypothetical protein [Bacteroidales bacterium]